MKMSRGPFIEIYYGGVNFQTSPTFDCTAGYAPDYSSE